MNKHKHKHKLSGCLPGRESHYDNSFLRPSNGYLNLTSAYAVAASQPAPRANSAATTDRQFHFLVLSHRPVRPSASASVRQYMYLDAQNGQSYRFRDYRARGQRQLDRSNFVCRCCNGGKQMPSLPNATPPKCPHVDSRCIIAILSI